MPANCGKPSATPAHRLSKSASSCVLNGSRSVDSVLDELGTVSVVWLAVPSGGVATLPDSSHTPGAMRLHAMPASGPEPRPPSAEGTSITVPTRTPTSAIHRFGPIFTCRRYSAEPTEATAAAHPTNNGGECRSELPLGAGRDPDRL